MVAAVGADEVVCREGGGEWGEEGRERGAGWGGEEE